MLLEKGGGGKHMIISIDAEGTIWQNPIRFHYNCCCSVAKSCPTLGDLMAWARPVPLSSTVSQSLLEFKSTELLVLSNHLILCRPLLLLPSIFPSIRVFSNELALGSLYHVAKELKLQLQQQSFQLIFRWIHDNSTHHTRKGNPFAKCRWSFLHMKGNIIRNRQKCEFYQ